MIMMGLILSVRKRIKSICFPLSKSWFVLNEPAFIYTHKRCKLKQTSSLGCKECKVMHMHIFEEHGIFLIVNGLFGLL